MNSSDWQGTLITLLLCAFLCGCEPPQPAPHAVLTVDETGRLNWRNQPLEASKLAEAVKQARDSNGNLVVEVDASPKAPIAVVQQTVQVMREAKVTLAFTHPLESLEQRTRGLGESADIR